MQLPTLPPETGNDTSSRFWQELEAKLAPLEDSYLHWDQLQQKTMPVQGINHKQWWQLLKAKRRARLQKLPFNFDQQHFYWILDDELLKLSTMIEQQLSLHLPKQFTDILPADRFLTEAIASCQLADASVELAETRSLLTTGRPVASAGEAAVEACYHALCELDGADLTATSLLTLNQKLTQGQGGWRETEHEFAEQDGFVTKAVAPGVIAAAVAELCEFANTLHAQYRGYLPPLVKAIILHYMCATIHPFASGNGRTARALFYWSMLKSGYSFVQFISLSQALYADNQDYAFAFLLTQTDANDLTYFIMQQLHSLQQALLMSSETLQNKQKIIQNAPSLLTPRQAHVLAEMQQFPERLYRLARYQARMQITYETSRTDLMKLAKHGLAKKQKIGKAFVYGLA